MSKPTAEPTLPDGTVTFLFTDIEASTRLWEEAPQEMMQALASHDEIIERDVADNRGVVVRPRGEGDSRFAVFKQARDAVAAAAVIQRQLYAEKWPTPRPLKVRMALHTGEADLRLGDYYGSAVNRCARLRSIAHGGQTVLSRATWELAHDALPANVRLQDEGRHRLKDLSQPEHVFQLCIGGLPQEFPLLRSLTVIPNNLPILLTEFIGREETIEEIRRLLKQTRLLTLVGPGGIGKSRLSIETSARLADQFRHGVFFIPLAPIASAEAVTQAIAEGIGLSLANEEGPREQLLNYFRSKQLLLVADNFEHVSEASGLLDEILRGAPQVKILVTSRIKLNLEGETAYPVHGLRFDDWSARESVAKNEAVQLFMATAQRARPGFELSVSDQPALRRILTLVQGSPLGILLAASWVDVLPVAAIADEITRDLDFLETEMSNVPERHRSIRAAFNYSWRLLSPPERALFCALSVFRGGFTRQAAQQVAGASLRQLANLANKSFLNTSADKGRYYVHELLRQYGEEALGEDAARHEAARTAHARCYALFMEEAWFRITHDQQREALLDVETDIENVRTAWRYLVAQGEPDDALRMIRSLWSVHEIWGWYVAGEELFGDAVLLAGGRPSSAKLRRLAAMSESAQAWFVALLGRPGAGAALAERATSALRELGRADELAFADIQMLMSLYLSADNSRVKQCGQEALESSSDPWIIVNVHTWLLFVATNEGSSAEHEAHLAILEGLLESSADYWLLYWLNLNKAVSALEVGDFDKGREHLEHTLNIVKAVNMKRGLHHTLYNLGITARAQKDYSAAQTYLLQSMRVSEELGGKRDIASALVDLAIVLSATGETERALELAAAAYAHPLSAQVTIWNAKPVRERADVEVLRTSLEGPIDPEMAQAAWQRGLAADFDRLVEELIETSCSVEIGAPLNR